MRIAGRFWKLAPGVDPVLADAMIRRPTDGVHRGEAANVKTSRRGMPVSLPLAVGEERRMGRLLSGYRLSPTQDDVVDLRRLMADPDLRPGERRAIVTSFAIFSRQVHDAGFD